MTLGSVARDVMVSVTSAPAISTSGGRHGPYGSGGKRHGDSH
jgi:hypothetical protein